MTTTTTDQLTRTRANSDEELPLDLEGSLSLEDGGNNLKELVGKHIDRLEVLHGLGADLDEVRGIIKLKLNFGVDVFTQEHLRSSVIEAHVEFWAYSAHRRLWHVKIIIDADCPPTGSTKRPHFGWEIYVNQRRMVGRGHIFFPQGISMHSWRCSDYNNVSELWPGEYTSQSTCGNGRIDETLRFFRLGQETSGTVVKSTMNRSKDTQRRVSVVKLKAGSWDPSKYRRQRDLSEQVVWNEKRKCNTC